MYVILLYSAMENTLQVMNGKNEKFRQSLRRADASSKNIDNISNMADLQYVLWTGEEAGRMEILEGQWRAAINKQRHKKKQVQQIEEDIQVYNYTCQYNNILLFTWMHRPKESKKIKIS